MPHPRAGYYTKEGLRVPGVTTILSRFKESGALITWAYNRGKGGLELYESRDKAAEVGTVVHEMAEVFIKGGNPHELSVNLPIPDGIQVESAFSAFQEWFESNKFTVISQEEQLVSEQHLYGGTSDAIARDSKDRIVLIDFKTSSAVYSEHLYQLGAYRILWDEAHPDTPLTGGSHLARFSKEHGDFSHHFFPDLAEAERGFLLMRHLYTIDAELKKRVK